MPRRQVLHHLFLSVPQYTTHCLENSEQSLIAICRIMLRHASKGKPRKEGLVHGLRERRAGGESVSSESSGVTSTPVLDDVSGSRAPEGAHGGLQQKLQGRAETRVSIREPGPGHQTLEMELSGLCLALNKSSQTTAAPPLHVFLPPGHVSGKVGPRRTYRVSLSH